MIEFWIPYLIIGFIVGARASCHIAWKEAPDKSKAKLDMDWWYTPVPLLVLLGCAFGWPLMASGYGLVKSGLFDPPKEVKEKIKAAKLKELEKSVL